MGSQEYEGGRGAASRTGPERVRKKSSAEEKNERKKKGTLRCENYLWGEKGKGPQQYEKNLGWAQTDEYRVPSKKTGAQRIPLRQRGGGGGYDPDTFQKKETRKLEESLGRRSGPREYQSSPRSMLCRRGGMKRRTG